MTAIFTLKRINTSYVFLSGVFSWPPIVKKVEFVWGSATESPTKYKLVRTYPNPSCIWTGITTVQLSTV